MRSLRTVPTEGKAFDAIIRDICNLLGGDGDLLRLVYGLRCLYVSVRKGEESLLPGCIQVWVAHGTIHLSQVAASWSKRDWMAFCTAIYRIRQASLIDLLEFLAGEESQP